MNCLVGTTRRSHEKVPSWLPLQREREREREREFLGWILTVSYLVLVCLPWQTEEEMGRQHQGMDRPGVRQVPEGSGK